MLVLWVFDLCISHALRWQSRFCDGGIMLIRLVSASGQLTQEVGPAVCGDGEQLKSLSTETSNVFW